MILINTVNFRIKRLKVTVIHINKINSNSSLPNFKMNTFSTLSSPSKKLLNFEEFTPAKVMVGCDINGWLETHKKSPLPQPKRKPPKCFHMRINADNKTKENVPPSIKPISTHAPNNQNMLSIIKLKVQMEAFSTKCKTSETKKNSIVGNKKSQD